MVAASALILSVSCSANREYDIVPEHSGDTDAELVELAVSAVFGEEVRTHLEGYSPKWDENDQISLFGSSATNACMTAVSTTGSTAVFSGTADAAGPYAAAYPYSTVNSWDGTQLQVTIPSEQRAGDSNIDPSAMTSVAYASEIASGLSFRNVAGLLKITIGEIGVTSVKVYSNSAGESMSGKFSVNPSTGAIASAVEGSSCVTLLPSSLTFTPGTYYIAVAPGEYQKGITISLTRAADYRKGERTSENKLTLGRAEVVSLGSYSMTNINWGYKIYTFQDFKNYALDVNHWDEEGETVELKADIDMNNENWKPLSDTYSGTFEGNGHCLYNICVKRSDVQHVGVFGKYAKDVQNVIFGSKDGVTYDGTSVIENSYAPASTVDNFAYAAPITFPDGFITNVKNFAAITITKSCTRKSRIGGISAFVERETVFENCVNYGTVTQEANSGKDANVNCAGILGGINVSNVKIINCVNYGTVISRNIYVKGLAGIVGLSYSASNYCGVENCVNYGEIRLEYSDTHNDFVGVGGIMGRSVSATGNDRFYIRNCTNYGKIHGEAVHQQAVGGICGRAEGSEIDGCVNEGAVEIDHTKKATTRWQCIGGIVGAALSNAKTVTSSVTNCINRGTVATIMTASSGHTATPKSTTVFYGVCGGGIIGLADALETLTGNRNYGSVTIENAFKGTSTYPAPAYAAGILGRDFAKIDSFESNTNYSTAVITAKTTNTSSAKANVKAGGVVASLENSTMASGTNHGKVITSKVESSGTAYAGTVCGDNLSVISLAIWGGECNGTVASKTNIIGHGTAPVLEEEASDETTDKPEGGLPDHGYEGGEWN